MRTLRYKLLIAILIIAVNAGANAQNISPYITNKNFKEQQKFKFEISNLVNSTLSFSKQSKDYEMAIMPDNFSKNYINNNINLNVDNQIFAKGALKLKNNNFIGATAKFELNYNTTNKKQNPNLDQFFIYHENDFGKFEFGNYQAVNQKMKFGPTRFARGAGGINGKYLEYVNLPTLSNKNLICSENILKSDCQNIQYPRFIMLAQSPIGHGGYAKGFYPRDVDNNYLKNNLSDFNKYNFRTLKDDSFEGLEDALKLSYYSPKINDIQVGFSYTPRSSNQGFTSKTAPDSRDLKLRDLWSFGINYSHDFDNLNLSLSSTAETAKPIKNSEINRNDLISFDVGGSLSYFGFTIGGSYGSWGKSLSAKNQIYQNNIESSYYTSGIAYQIGPIKSSITSLNSNFQNNKYRALSFGIDYKLKKNLITYIELTRFEFEVKQIKYFDLSSQIKVANSLNNLQNNSGNVFLTGIYYIF